MKTVFTGWEVMVGLLTLAIPAAAGPKGSVEIEVANVARDKGVLVCALYDRADNFPSEEDVFASATSTIANGRAVCRFAAVPAGRYAVAAFHDEDADGKLKRVLGMPREGYGFSNGAQAGVFGPPPFSAAAFPFDGGSLRLPVQLRYP
jgi:uncharacterized protein (DUF2141 family)